MLRQMLDKLQHAQAQKIQIWSKLGEGRLFLIAWLNVSATSKRIESLFGIEIVPQVPTPKLVATAIALKSYGINIWPADCRAATGINGLLSTS